MRYSALQPHHVACSMHAASVKSCMAAGIVMRPMDMARAPASVLETDPAPYKAGHTWAASNGAREGLWVARSPSRLAAHMRILEVPALLCSPAARHLSASALYTAGVYAAGHVLDASRSLVKAHFGYRPMLAPIA